ncbi:hypothetical protein [Ideonella sp.]|uniref:hypothetical protein n=1 Tax=Ideonella sp. TaxID=1929293 RepID=UPI0035B05D91
MALKPARRAVALTYRLLNKVGKTMAAAASQAKKIYAPRNLAPKYEKTSVLNLITTNSQSTGIPTTKIQENVRDNRPDSFLVEILASRRKKNRRGRGENIMIPIRTPTKLDRENTVEIQPSLLRRWKSEINAVTSAACPINGRQYIRKMSITAISGHSLGNR